MLHWSSALGHGWTMSRGWGDWGVSAGGADVCVCARAGGGEVGKMKSKGSNEKSVKQKIALKKDRRTNITYKIFV